MQLQLKEYNIPEPIQFNYDELKAELADKVHIYETMVYDDGQIKQAKADRADLNRLKKALNDERIRREREYMEPFKDFKGKIDEIIGIIDKPVAVIDKQVKAYEEKCKEEKKAEIEAYWAGHAKGFEVAPPDWLTLEQIFDDKWLNASASMTSIEQAIKERCSAIAVEVKTLEGLSDFSFEAIQEYKRSLNLSQAIAEGQRLADIQKRKAEAEAQKAQAAPTACKPAEPVDVWADDKGDGRAWVSFKARVNLKEAQELNMYLKEHGIQFEAI